MSEAPPASPRRLALGDVPLARRWARRALAAALHLERRLEGLPTPGVAGARSLVWAEALAVHFKLRAPLADARACGGHRVGAAPGLLDPVGLVRSTFARLVELLGSAPAIFHDAPADAATSHRVDADAIAYTLGGQVWFTPRFAPPGHTDGGGYARPARAAMVLHELVHVLDPLSGDDENHISEWDPRYAAMTAEQSVHNASSYAAFAQHATYLTDARFGAGAETRHAEARALERARGPRRP